METKREAAPDELSKISIGNFIQRDAEELILARRKGRDAHDTDDIRVAGDEVERVYREILARKLPAGFHVGHGHIVDSELHASPQLDVIISDTADTPVLAAMNDGTEYLPYESVYAVGEVKSAFYKSKKPIEAFGETLTKLDGGLRREKAAQNYLGRGLTLGPGLKTDEKRPYRNPMFSFMIFVDSGDFDIDSVTKHYDSAQASRLPNVVCLLDKGVIVAAKVRTTESGDAKLGPISIQPQFDLDASSEERLRWVMIPVGAEERRTGATFGFLFFALMMHLGTCVLTRPDLLRYLGSLFGYAGGTAFADAR